VFGSREGQNAEANNHLFLPCPSCGQGNVRWAPRKQPSELVHPIASSRMLLISKNTTADRKHYNRRQRETFLISAIYNSLYDVDIRRERPSAEREIPIPRFFDLLS
jgi:hypothetical protein